MSNQRVIGLCIVAMLAVLAIGGVLFSGALNSQAVQNPTLSLDMVPSGNSYDDATNTMAVGASEDCLTSGTANANTHAHAAQLVIRNVEDLVGWQARFNFIGDKMRVNTINFMPFTDNNTGQNIGFTNLPIDASSGLHRTITSAGGVGPVAPPDGSNTSQTHLAGATYDGVQNFAVSPDTPAKATPDDVSYDAPAGGVLATVSLQVVGNEVGQSSLFMNLDDGSPTPPSSRTVVFTDSGSVDINLASSALGDGYHGEGVTCVPQDCVNNECPPTAQTPTPTPTPSGGPPPTQNPRLSLDMDPSGTTYSDPGAGGDNSIMMGPIDNCLSSAPPGNNLGHNHTAHVVVQDVHDLVGWQIRMNYDGGKMRPQSVNFAPFTDTLRGQNVSFQNLPIDASTDMHRGLTFGQSIPAAAPGPQTALIGSVYGGPFNFPLSPDTPAKSPPDDTSYGAAGGGVVAALSLRVEAGNAGNPSLFVNLDDDSPNAPGSKAIVFNGSGTTDIELGPEALGDGYHGEGTACVPLDCVNNECPPAGQTPPPTPTPGPDTPTPTAMPTSGPPPVQNPRISLDMDPSGTTYSDPGAGGDNSIMMGPIDNCLSTAPPGNNLAHNHQADIVIQDVQDLVAWQVRMNYDGGQMRPQSVNFAPFTDTLRGQNVSFQNLPIDASTDSHRSLTGGQSIPPAAPGPQTALIGSTYDGVQGFAISPDTPAKSPPDDTSYSTAGGGVVARVNLGVAAGNAGNPSLFMNLDDNSPNPPGSRAIVFTGSGTMDINLGSSALGDGYHGEGTTCVPLDCVNNECPPTGQTPTPTPTPSGGPPPTQNPRLSLDMDPSGTTYSDPGAGGDNSIMMGPIDNCLSSAPPGNNLGHNHPVHIVVQDVQDLVAWQVRMNYDGGQMRPQSVNFTPFTDTLRGQNVSFQNLPIDASTDTHRDITGAQSIPAPAPGPQTALIGSVYDGQQNFPISPDTPAKSPPDDTSYSTAGGGVVAAVNLRVEAGNAGNPSLFMNLDDGNPNAPGSKAIVFTGSGTMDINLASSALGDGYHGEGTACVPLDCVNNECPGSGTPTPIPTPTPTATRTPTPTAPPTPAPTATPTPASVAGHDARLGSIDSVPDRVRLSPGEVITDTARVEVVNQSNHMETIGVYVDVLRPVTGCTPHGRVLQTNVTLSAGSRTTIPVTVSYSCSNPSAADGLKYKWVAVADHGANDLASCGFGTLQGSACFNALANDDRDPADNRKTQNRPRVNAD